MGYIKLFGSKLFGMGLAVASIFILVWILPSEENFFLAEVIEFPIIISTFLLLMGITVYATNKNKEIYQHLKVHANPSSSEHFRLLKDLQYEYLQDNEEKDPLSREHIQSIIESYFAQYYLRGKYNVAQRLKLIQTLGSITILVGVLGTFVGLVLALRGINENDIQNSIMPILSGINTAFYTSIAGIICSVVINLHTKFKNSDQLFLNLMLTVENSILAEEQESANNQVVEAIAEVGNEIKSLKQSFIDVQRFSEGFERATNNMNQFNADFGKTTSRLKSMFTDMETIMESFNERSQQIHDDFGRLFDYFQQQETFQQELYTGVQSTNERIHTFMDQHQAYQHQQILTMQNLHQEQQQFFNDTYTSFDSIKEQIEGAIHKSMDTMHDAYESMSNFLGEMLDKQESIVQSQLKFENKNTQLMENVDNATSTMKDVLENTSFEQLSSITSGWTEQTEKLSSTLENTTEALHTMQEKSDHSTKLLGDINEGLTQQAQRQTEMQDHFTNHLEKYVDQNNSIHHSFEEAIEIFKQHKVNNEQLSNLAVEMKEEFARNYQTITKQTSELHNSLQGYIEKTSKQIESFIRQAETNMDENLGKSIKEFRNYVQTTNEILDNRFNELQNHFLINDEFRRDSLTSLEQSMKSLDQTIGHLAEKVGEDHQKQLVYEG
ncbi:MotA/TolQ/ExbB proton channel family protein [Pontibacillus yanchengensis]|uniref:MotA/TolQ/ExbB proton channel domain-containing protein n=1 Tax=Pontibacillus yanchengensis Y32 TaxID=1385514 RepID=A0A0A2TFP3_9BACI|nr:MotA/TolQ/ExbB proton channel family protein [Pontibacillus yanchengensis]KGP74682.1 hypothetical protein N782_00465 [Pontibacillus yanchengensis Y32]